MRSPRDRLNVRPRDDVLRALAGQPWAHDFFQALRTIEALHADKPRLGTARRPADEPVRLGQAPELSFAPATLHAAWAADAYGKPRIEVRFFGLFGPNGPLPLHLTEYARERLLHDGDATFARFADIFHHRLLLLFYRAWAQAQPTASLDRPGDDRFGAFVGALVGLGTPALRNRDAAPDDAKLHCAGLLARQVRNAEGLESLLSGYLRRKVRVEPFAGRWLALPPSERTRIGARAAAGAGSAVLGRGAVLGATVWDRQHNFRLHVGPLDGAAFEGLLPAGSALPAVAALVAQYVGFEFGWDVCLRVADDAAQPSRLGRRGRLGWTSWIGGRRGGEASVVIDPEAALRRFSKPRASAPIHH